MKEEKYRKFLTICHEVGWKCTSQRLAVYDFLDDNLTHPDVEVVWRAVRKNLPSITRESVYRILNELSEKGIISRIDHIESARYDSRTNPHGHFICEKCGTIFDFDLSEGEHFPPVKIPGKIRHLEFRAVGICEACARKSARKTIGKQSQTGHKK